jgi:hypothetical protein
VKRAVVVFLVLLVTGVIAGGNYYVVSGKGQTAAVPKSHFTLSPIFINVDSWSVLDLVTNREIVLDIVRAGKGGMLPGGGVIDAVNAVGKIGAAVMDQVAGHAARAVSKAGAEAVKDVGQAVDKALEPHPDAQQALQHGADAVNNAATQAKAAIDSDKAKEAVERGKAAINQWGSKLRDATQKQH